MTRAEAEAFCADWLPRWTGNRPDALLELYAEDVAYRDPARPGGVRGREALAEYFRLLLARNPEWRWHAEEIHPIEGGFTLLWRAEIPVGDRVVEERGLDWIFVRDGRIVRAEVFFDRSRLRAQPRPAPEP